MLDSVGKNKTRQLILEGIYRENHRVFSNKPLVSPHQWLYLLFKRILLVALVAPIAFFSSLANHEAGLPLYEEMTANVPYIDAIEQTLSFDFESAELIVEPSTEPLVKPDIVLSTSKIKVANAKLKAKWQSTLLPPLGNAQQGAFYGEDYLAWQNQHQDYFKANTLALSEVFGLDIKTIVIDPGHGGKDPGTSGKGGLQEKVIALDVALRLKERLEANTDYRVLLTRDKDEFISLSDRIDFANDMHADLFISVHVNYLPSKPNNMIETYYYGMTDDQRTLKLARHENRGSNVGMHDFTNMVEKLGGTLKLQESKRLAAEIQNSLYTNISKGDKSVLNLGIKQAPFLVIMGTEMPGVLAEVTCLSNSDEEQKLQDPAYRDDIAGFLEAGLINYLEKGDYSYARQ